MGSTPRDLLVKGGLRDVRKTAAVAEYAKCVIIKEESKRHLQSYDKMKRFIPSNTLVGKNDEIPGISELPSFSEPGANMKFTVLKDHLYLHDVHILVVKGWETKLLEDISVPLSKKYDFPAEGWRKILSVNSRMLNIKIHNSWNAMRNQTLSLEYSSDEKRLEASVVPVFKNIVVDHNVAIIFELEYTLEIKRVREKVHVSPLFLIQI